VRLSVLTLLQHPTIEQLARVLRREQNTSGTPRALVRLQAGESHLRPLFLVHGGGGSVLAYTDLVRQLGPTRPLYGLHAPGLDGGEPLPASVEEMARHYLAQLREVQPAGPYFLGGWSFGGLVALEMAQQLQAAGETVALLALIDSHAPVARPEPDELSLLAAFGQNLGLSWQHLSLEPERLKQLSGRALLAYVLEQASSIPGGAPALELDQAERYFTIFKRHHEALRHYAPRPYKGPAVLLKASMLSDSGNLVEDLGWSPWLTGNFVIYPVPGDHYTLLRAPHVATLVERLAHDLNTLDAQEAA
jgi:thioesterase domain-containing protein